MSETEERTWFGNAVGRRNLLRAGMLGGAGLAAAALIGCGGDDEGDSNGGNTGGTSTSGGSISNSGTTVDPTADYVTRAEADGAPFPYGYEEPDTEPKTGGTLNIAVPWDVSTFDVNKSAAADTYSVANAVGNRLIGQKTGPELDKYQIEYVPELAKSWEMAPDGLSYTFNLNTGVKFHNVNPVNGREFTAQDVVKSYERARSGGSNAAFFALVDTITAPDDATVKITMKTPDADFLAPLSSRALTIYPPEVYDQNLADTVAIGTGPVILGEVSKGNYVRGTSNPDYFEGKPYLDGIEWRIIKDSSAQIAAFRAGQVEFALSQDTSIASVEALIKSNPGIQIQCDPILAGITRIGLNAANPKFQDERVRQALHMAVDREKFIQLVYQGYGKVVPGFGWPYLFDQTPTEAELGPWWKYDPTEAKAMLSAAGAENLEFDLFTAISYTPTIESVNAPLADFFRQVGVTMNLKNLDYQAFNGQYYARNYAKENGEAIQGWSTQAPSANGFFYDAVYSQSVKNYFAINDAEIDDWAVQQRSELDAETRKGLQRKIWDKALASAYYIDSPTTFTRSIFQPWLRYYRFNGAYISLHYYYEWGQDFHKAWLDK